MTIRPTHPDGTPLTIREQLERAGARKSKRAEKAATLWPPRVPRIKTNTVAALEAILWDVFSIYIRLRDKIANNGWCFYCGVRPIQCAMHRIKRGRRAVKYDERNVDGGCHYCNGLDGPFNQSQKFDAIFIKRKGVELFLELEAKGRETCPRSRVDIIEKTEYFRAQTRTLLTSRSGAR